MPLYKVHHAYRSRRDGVDYGPYEPGSTVDLEPADAEWVNRDSPGCLTRVRAEPAQPPAHETRPHRGGRNRGS